MLNYIHQREGNFLKLKNRKLKIMSNKETYCLKASSQQLARLAELMDERSRATGFDEPVVYLGTPYLLDPIPFSGSEKPVTRPGYSLHAWWTNPALMICRSWLICSMRRVSFFLPAGQFRSILMCKR